MVVARALKNSQLTRQPTDFRLKTTPYSAEGCSFFDFSRFCSFFSLPFCCGFACSRCFCSTSGCFGDSWGFSSLVDSSRVDSGRKFLPLRSHLPVVFCGTPSASLVH